MPTCEYHGDPDCDREAVAYTTVSGEIITWFEARCRTHLCEGVPA